MRMLHLHAMCSELIDDDDLYGRRRRLLLCERVEEDVIASCGGADDEHEYRRPALRWVQPGRIVKNTMQREGAAVEEAVGMP